MKRLLPVRFTHPGLSDLALFLLFFGAVWGAPGMANDPGVGWHLKTGQWISENQQIPITDPFLATSVNKPWISNQWLSDLLFWKFFSLGNWELLHVFTALLIIAPFAVLAGWGRKEGEGGVTLFLAIVFCGLTSTVQWMLRPVIFSFLLFAVLYALLRRYERSIDIDWVVLLALLPLFVVWANLHPGFPMGFALIGCFVIGLLCDFQLRSAICLGIAAVLALAATLINPYDLQLLKGIVGLIGNKYFMQLNMEWLSPDFLSIARFPALILLGIIMLWPSKQLTRAQLCAVALFLFMSLVSVRYLPFFAIACLLPVSQALRSLVVLNRMPLKRGSAWGYTGSFIGVMMLVVTFRQEIPGRASAASSPGADYPREAIAEILKHEDPGVVFLTPDWGGFLTFYAYPKRIAFIDDRNELNGQELYEKYFEIVQARGEWRRALDELDINWMLLSPTDIVAIALAKDPSWTMVKESTTFKLFRRTRL